MKKLGQQLIERGWINRGDLDRALATQSTFGGTFGTCLLEAGALREEQLLEALAGYLKYEPAGAELLRSVPAEAVRLIPEKLAGTHRAVPIGLHRGRLAVAAVDPRDLQCQDEFAFAASRKVSMSVALEIRIAEALERYYGIPCSQRFTRILDRLNRVRYLWSEPQEKAAITWESPSAQLFPEAPSLRAPELPEVDVGPGTPAWDTASPAATETAPPRQPLPRRPAVEAETDRPPGTETKPAEDRDDRPRSPRASTGALEAGAPEAGTSEAGAEPSKYDRLLKSASNRDEIGREVLIQLRTHFERAALFAALKDGVQGWMGAGPGLAPSRLADYRVTYEQPSVFLNLRRGIGFHLGPLPPMPPHRDLARCWQDEPPESCFLLPINVRGHLAAVLYGDRLGRSLAGLDLEEIRDLGRAAGSALERCIVLKKQTEADARAV